MTQAGLPHDYSPKSAVLTNKIQLGVTRGIPKLTTKQKTHMTASKDAEQIEEFNKHFSGLVLFFLIGSIQANLETIM